MNKGALLIISGPSGSGKSSLLKRVFSEVEDAYFSISTTTRAMREGEIEGKHYRFVTKEQFLNDIEEERFLEWAEVHGNFYGTSKASVFEALEQGKLVVFDIDVQGFNNIYENYKEYITSVFIPTPTRKELKERLVHRKTDAQEVIITRVAHAYNEMKYIKGYDYLIVNDDLEKSSQALLSIAKAARFKRSLYDLSAFVSEWKN